MSSCSSEMLDTIGSIVAPDEQELIPTGKNNLHFVTMGYRLDVVILRHAIKSANKHRSHPSMHRKACAPAIRCWSDR